MSKQISASAISPKHHEYQSKSATQRISNSA